VNVPAISVRLILKRREQGMTVKISINRAPVLTLWAAVVAERLGFDPDEALTLGKSVAGLTAYRKGQSLGLFEPAPATLKKKRAAARKGMAAFENTAFLGPVPRIQSTEFRAACSGCSGQARARQVKE
jgi:hypothetical protein